MMIGSNMLQIVLAMALVMVLLAVALVPAMRRRDRMDARIRAIAGGALRATAGVPAMAPARAGGSFAARLVRNLGHAVVTSGLLSSRSMADLEQTMAVSGQRSATALPLFVGAKVMLFLGLPVATWIAVTVFNVSVHPKILPVVVAAVIGLLAPDFMVRRARKRYLERLENGLPDALDLLIICSEAGLALEAGFDRVAAEMRQQTLTRFEDKASRLPVLLTIPMILFILPCIFLVVGGPAVVSVMNTLMHR